MHASALLLSVILLLMGAGCETREPRIDGSSEEAFKASHKRLLDSLTPEDKLQFTLAEVVWLSQFECAQIREPITDSAFLNEFFGGQMSVKACRRELDGKSFSEIMKLGAEQSTPSKP